ncbi:MAG TPA: asparagine synthase (glutamine-hydrolyzing) [Vicinamibacteria bacterium]|nr:asparagine synthase (glutamine-hydrolyzing) [Vicinamibacteria bacterium]
MCGFAGIFNYGPARPVARGELEPMLETLWYRGPDGEGYLEDDGIAIGFRRLAIIDLEGGGQPMPNEDRTVWVASNGEIYNYRELARVLEGRGHRIATRSDTEVIVHAWEEWGESCVERLRGIFAFALWDQRRRRLFLARDRSGIKPLAVLPQRDRILFASEAKALLAAQGVPRRLDLLGYLGGADLGSPLTRTAFEGIRELGAGCFLVAAPEGHRVERYWRYEPSEASDGGGPEQPVERFRELFEEAVRMQLVSDVPVAAALSGGVDSAALVAAIVRADRRDIRTYTVDFGDDESADVAHARLVAASLRVRNTAVPCPGDAATLEALPFVAWAAEGEFDLGYVGRYALARAVRADGAKVLLSGQGVDEILTGYCPSYARYQALALLRHLEERVRPTYRGWPAFGEGVLEDLRARLADDDSNAAPDLPRLAGVVAAELRAEHSRLATSLLRFEDRMGMAGHVEVRVPFLDHRLVEYSAAFPEPARRELFSGKALLRRAVAAWLPDEVVRRPKLGFNRSAPAVTRLICSLPEGSPLRQLLSREAVLAKGYFPWERCEGFLRAGDYTALDHVFVVHLLDELFVRSFDPARFSRRQAGTSAPTASSPASN